MLRWTALLLVALVPGCGTINSYASGCPGFYSGVHQNHDLLREYWSNLAGDAPPGRLAVAWDATFVALDMPIAAASDTLGLPLAWALGPRTPQPPGHLGCRRIRDTVEVRSD